MTCPAVKLCAGRFISGFFLLKFFRLKFANLLILNLFLHVCFLGPGAGAIICSKMFYRFCIISEIRFNFCLNYLKVLDYLTHILVWE
ncbi:hypothetical protein X474_17245 [Dethiosulfatarculus sandiegensis]|uniref:Uncharacterized protein n=1 Tax=Dethiosulfatarculus sandiegensis TaxID=1429043 RepID=A0A0D2JTK8_9BACT|nr:hypothetical protein X474_17245 [Dethiosulfatarculus sandiegensis]